MNVFRNLFLAASAMVAAGFVMTGSAVAQSPFLSAFASPVAGVRASEAEVRSLPIYERPNRLGHFYGNTVRRRHYGTLIVNQAHTERPVARYFYIAR